MPYPGRPRERVDAIIALHADGLPLREISARVGVSSTVITRVLREHPDQRVIRKVLWTADEDALLCDPGLSNEDVARITGRTRGAANARRRYLRSHRTPA